jgi:hypothetical protein
MPIKRTLLINIDEEIIVLLWAFKNIKSCWIYFYHHCEKKPLSTTPLPQEAHKI